ncbi:Na+/H+ antiporter subunit G [Ancylobacter vacuolatus]|uniref:Multicomponent K+:H+ antiporter subunit G n=1 Tax=Ancylobacter vacuolatus TaxID=223389 RepID=A0ABU0DI94_9HYPH|nr:Na+/H+ antiporter subunit G [Ancylobacter vacuolatus]MDQ0348141.1 multicomponent K+:H+ antiporter subunit G [Ancylobacter vacuolatus]
MAFVVELIISALLVIGAFFLLVGSLGLAKLPDTMRRLHGPTKATTLGIGSLLIASMLYFFTQHGQLSIHELLITLFLFLTAPISANMIAKAHILRSARERGAITPAGTDTGWATLQPPRPSKGP